ncbi:hypothetical protein ACO2Q1_08770 [Brevundimonas sp. VNH65]|uniref:hypothetical protein n=1 Tax=Brevundimonas sp. VNH65 TaxID=3400917 RepID=UPI003C096CB9
MSRLPIQRPINVARDLKAAVFTDQDISLFDLYADGAGQGVGIIRDRVFRGCRLQGPAILLISVGCSFDDVNFGDSGGDIRNLILYPAGARALGTVPIRDCVFDGCEFINVGFTGDRGFLDQLLSVEAQGG